MQYDFNLLLRIEIELQEHYLSHEIGAFREEQLRSAVILVKKRPKRY